MRRPFLSAVLSFLIAAKAFGADAAPVGKFDGHQDIGAVLHPGNVVYDPTKQTYTITGSGENMWFTNDAFQFLWKNLSGDYSLAADIAFQGTGGNPHRKAVLVVRQTLDADSAYADAARHGEGLTSLQSREEKGATTHEIQANVSGPARVAIEKRGSYVYMLVGEQGKMARSGGSMRLELSGPYYIGLGVCSHDKDVSETAVFSNVDLHALPAAEPRLYSTLETITVTSTDRRVVYVAPERFEAPNWSKDGASLFFKRAGRIERISVKGGSPEPADAGAGSETPLTRDAGHNDGREYSPDGSFIYFHSDRGGSMQIWRMHPDGSAVEQVTSDEFNNWFPRLSPDGTQMAMLSYGKDVSGHPENKDVQIRLMQLGDKKIRILAKLFGGQGTMNVPSWSPDGKRLAFVSYQLVP